MSAYREQKTTFTDSECLMEALKEMGCKPEYHEEPQPLYGYQGDFRTADGNGHTKDPNKAMKAHIILPQKTVGSASNDIGFKKDEKGNYVAIISDYDSNRHNAKWMGQLAQAYADKKVRKTAKKLNLKFEDTKTDSKGNKVMKFTLA